MRLHLLIKEKFAPMGIQSIDYRTHPAYSYIRPTLRDRYEALRKFTPWFFSAIKQRIRVRPGICTDGCNLGINGAAVYRLPPETITRLRNYAQPYIDAIVNNKNEKGARTFKEKVVQVPERKSPELHKTVMDVLEELHIIPHAQHYRGYPLHISHLAVQVGDPEDSDWRDHFADRGIQDPPTSYFHIDGSIGNMKAIIYLSEVGEQNGPFRYVFGSNHVPGIIENAIRYGNDKSRLDHCDPEHRKLFAALPRMLQKKSEFGNDMQTGFDALVKNEHHFLSAQDGNFFLFDPNGIHRGGMVAAGRRLILQLNFQPHKPSRANSQTPVM